MVSSLRCHLFMQLAAPRTTGWTLAPLARYRRGMTPRRALFDPLQSTDKPTWLVVRNMTGAILDSEEISAGADLKRVFVAPMLEWLDAGWQVGEFSSSVARSFALEAASDEWSGFGRPSRGKLTAAARRDYRTARAAASSSCKE